MTAEYFLEGEETWISRSIDDTQDLIRSVRELAEVGLNQKTLEKESRQILRLLDKKEPDGWPKIDTRRWKVFAEKWIALDPKTDRAQGLLDKIETYKIRWKI